LAARAQITVVAPENSIHLARRSAVSVKQPSTYLSFVIPARDEEKHIGDTIDRIHTVVANHFPYEIIMVDHGSRDATPGIAAEHGAQVIVHPHGTIGTLRNVGAAAARGDVLVFLDADVRITPQWLDRLPHVIQSLAAQPRTITGSVCDVPADATWIERYWFSPEGPNRFGHVGSGHMITTRDFYQQLGGFNEALETGEDYDICARADAQGAVIVNDQLLRAEHIGYPATLRHFIRREAWHGRSDFLSLGRALRSRVALATMAFVASHVALVAGLLFRQATVVLVAVAVIVLLCAGSAAYKFRGQRITSILVTTAVYYAYFVGRSIAALNVLTRRRSESRTKRKLTPKNTH
jgi:hypothetical protein